MECLFLGLDKGHGCRKDCLIWKCRLWIISVDARVMVIKLSIRVNHFVG